MARSPLITNLIGLTGSVEAGGLLTSYVRGTSTPVALYVASTGSSLLSNPVVADSLGQITAYLDDAVSYSLSATTANGATILWQADVISGTIYYTYVNSGLLTEFEETATGTGASQIITIEDVVLTSPYQVLVHVDALLQPVTGYTVASDGTDSTVTLTAASGATIYVRSNAVQGLGATTGDDLVIPTGATVGRALEAWTGDVFNVKAGWGGAAAVGDGSADDGAAINRAIVACNAAGGGEVFIPEGTYRIENTGGAVGVSMLSNVHLRGAGVGATILKLKAAADAHVLNISGLSNASVRHLSIDGTRASQTIEVHGLRIGGTGLTNQNIRLEHLEIYDTYHYGIGIQGGTNKDITARSIELHDIGADGFDVKNLEDNNENVVIDDLSVRRWGLAAGSVQAALDMRGAVSASNIYIVEPNNNDAIGIRFRNGELLDASGLGAHRATLTGFYIDLGTKTTAIGLDVGARDVTVSNGYVRGGQDGIMVQDSGFRGTAITVEACSDDGFWLRATGGGLDADGAVLTGCVARSCTDNGFRIDTDNVQLIGCESTGNDDGALISAGADGARIIGGNFSGNASFQIVTSGADTRVRDALGIVTQARGAASGTTDGSGDLTITHGLSTAPATVRVTTTGTTFRQAQVHTKTNTTFKIRFFDAAGAALTATSAAADWEAETALYG